MQEVSLQNAQNIAQLKWRHRTGNKAFAVIREKMVLLFKFLQVNIKFRYLIDILKILSCLV